MPTASESIAQSAATIGLGLVVFGTACVLFDSTEIGRSFWNGFADQGLQIVDWGFALPMVFLLPYYAMVHWHLHIRPQAAKDEVKAGVRGGIVDRMLIGWNLFLAVLSMAMLAPLVIGTLRVVREQGLRTYVCDGEVFWKGTDTLRGYTVLFAFTKVPELLDTVFLVARGRDVPFLHYYHHITVLVYCWLVLWSRFPASHSFGIMNSLVHSIMYYYYWRQAQGVRLAFGKLLTLIQLSQMVVGVLWTSSVTWFYFVNPTTCTGGAYCNGSRVWTVFGSTAAMYASYAALFASFYVKRWLSKPAPVAAEDGRKEK